MYSMLREEEQGATPLWLLLVFITEDPGGRPSVSVVAAAVGLEGEERREVRGVDDVGHGSGV